MSVSLETDREMERKRYSWRERGSDRERFRDIDCREREMGGGRDGERDQTNDWENTGVFIPGLIAEGTAEEPRHCLSPRPELPCWEGYNEVKGEYPRVGWIFISYNQ